jgi:hypothetical protein
MLKTVIFLLLSEVALGQTNSTTTTTQSLDPIELDILIELFQNTGGPNWNYNQGWLASDPCLSYWSGVICENRHVTELDLSYRGLTGVIPSSMWQLSALVTLYEPISANNSGRLGTRYAWTSRIILQI